MIVTLALGLLKGHAQDPELLEVLNEQLVADGQAAITADEVDRLLELVVFEGQRSPWDVDVDAACVLKQVRQLGYAVSVHRGNGTVEMHAVRAPDGGERHVARSADGDGGPARDFRTAVALAGMVGIDLGEG